VARALEPLRLLTEGHAAPEVHALLVQRHDPVDRHRQSGIVRLSGPRRPVPFDDVEPALADVIRLLVAFDERLDVADRAGVDLGPEAAEEVGPQEGDRPEPELGREQQDGGDQGPALEVTPGHHLDGLGRRLAGARELTIGAEQGCAEEEREQDDGDQHDDDGDGRGVQVERDHNSKNTPCAHGQIQL
jgi:hypothetical protein